MKRHIFIIGRNKMFCQRLGSELCNDKNQLYFAESIDEIISTVNNMQCDLIITELHKLGAELNEVIAVSEHNRSTPIMVMHEGLSIKEKVLLYHAGASTLLKISTAIEICAAQAQALIRLQKENRDCEKLYPLIFGNELMIDPNSRIVKVDGKILSLTKKESDYWSSMTT